MFMLSLAFLGSSCTSGELDSIFYEHYGDIVVRLNLDERVLFVLDNPLIPEEYAGLKPYLDYL